MDKGNRFGFISLKQLNAWFTAAELRKLEQHGFCVYEYDVPDSDIIFGRSQVAFPRGRKSYPRRRIRIARVVMLRA